MSKEVDRHAVFQTTRVRTSLKNDVCWIHKSKQEQEESRTEHAAETRPALAKQHSYVLSTARRFEYQRDVTVYVAHPKNFIGNWVKQI